MATLEQVVGCSVATLAGPEGRLLCLGPEPVAVVPDSDTVGALIARVGAGTGLPTLLGILTSVRPTGVLLVGNSDGEHSLAVELEEGRVVGAVGPQPHQSMGDWIVELDRRYEQARGAESFEDDTTVVQALRPGRVFLQEIVLEALSVCNEPGGSLLLLEGDVQWLHERLDAVDSQDIGFVLMELARREDEGAELESRLGPLTAVITPVSKPGGDRTASPRMNLVSDEGFEEEADAATNTEWIDARYVFAFCDGVTDVERVAELTLLGRFRTLSAVAVLVDHGHIRLVDGADASGEQDLESSDELADLIAAPELSITGPPTGLNCARIRERDRDTTTTRLKGRFRHNSGPTAPVPPRRVSARAKPFGSGGAGGAVPNRNKHAGAGGASSVIRDSVTEDVFPATDLATCLRCPDP